jgi:hypothetical protein
VAERLTADRLSTYLACANDDLRAAFDLYEWNMAVSGAVLLTVSMAEVVLRNALDAELTAWAAPKSRSWFDAVPIDKKGRSVLQEARDRATRCGAPELHGKVVAELSLGFWRYLLKGSYRNTLWRPALYDAFPGALADLKQRREDVSGHVQRLLFVRNRAAHHEPLLTRDLLADLRSAVEVTSWICVDSAAWLAAQSTLPAVFSQRPVVQRVIQQAGSGGGGGAQQ